MGLFDWLTEIFGGGGGGDVSLSPNRRRKSYRETFIPRSIPRLDMFELERRLGTLPGTLETVDRSYRSVEISKRSGGTRRLDVPNDALKKLQRGILHKLLNRLAVHPCAHGFVAGRSIVTNAKPHVGATLVLKMDLRDYFTRTTQQRVAEYFHGIGWDESTAILLAELCCYRGHLPQGAPTSPAISNLVNYPMDARIEGLARFESAVYTRYADDMTISWTIPDNLKTPDNQKRLADMVRKTIGDIKGLVRGYGYKLHHAPKLRVAREHQRMQVTGLVVNEKLALPRKTRRWLRAVEHHRQTGQPATLSDAQWQGWQALVTMVEQASDQDA
jgi:RNA-directed DNA polymerase